MEKRGKKQCKKCQASVGVRTKKCDCGYEFEVKAVPASPEPMSIEGAIKESLTSVKEIISKASSGNSGNSVSISKPKTNSQPQVQTTPPARLSFSGGKIGVPAGSPPYNPKGYKNGWPDGPASDEVVQNWALQVYNSGEGKYAVSAVVYWSRYFWDINGPEYHRVKDLIEVALQPQRSNKDYDSDYDDDEEESNQDQALSADN